MVMQNGNRGVLPGIDSLLTEKGFRLSGKRVGLMTNQTGVTTQLDGDAMVLRRVLGAGLCALFGPEHGFYGQVQDRERIETQIDPESGLPIYSLYGPQESPPAAVLRELDVLVFDMQDVGVRFYTYLTSMLYAMRAVASCGVTMMVLDRPNPITGTRVTGPRLSPSFASFEGACEIPVRHGMTLGELAVFLNETQAIGADVQVIPVAGWTRQMWYEETGLDWVPPSPNMPTVETTVVYPGTCLFEGTNVSEGRGTTCPFELIGAPWIDGRRFADALNALDIPGVRFRAAHFMPTFWKLQGEACQGVQVHVRDRASFEPLSTSLTMLAMTHRLWPERFEWVRWEPDAPYFIDLLLGTDQVRLQLDAGVPVQEIVHGWETDEQWFLEARRPFLLYE